MGDANNVPGGFSRLGLKNRVLEVAVIAGMDEETNLIKREAVSFYHTSSTTAEDGLFDICYKPFLLDIIAGPQDANGKYANSASTLKKPIDLFDARNSLKRPNTTPDFKRDIKNRKSKKKVQRSKSVQKLRKAANHKEEVPVSTDFLRNLPSVCLPDNSKVYESPKSTHIHHSVLTDISGCRHYATVLTFYRPFSALKESSTEYRLFKLQGYPHTDATIAHVPCCICLVSPLPYFDVMKDALSCLTKEIFLHPKSDFRSVIQKYVTNLSLVTTPCPFINVRFNIGALPMSLMSSLSAIKQEQVTDFDLRIPLFLFINKPELILKVLEYILLEQRVVFLSENYSYLTLCIEAFLRFICPFEWPHQYIPVLFSEIVDFLDCPGIFIMGCHSCHKHQVDQIENDLHIVDIDEGRVYQSVSTDPLSSGSQFVLQLPQTAKDKLLRRLDTLDILSTLSNLTTLSLTSLDEIRENAMKTKLQLNMKIRDAFMDLMVDLFGSALFYLNHETHQFKMNEFLESVSAADLPFYLKVTKTYLFRRFIRERLKRVRDDFDTCVNERHSRKNTNEIRKNRNYKKIRSLEFAQTFQVSSSVTSRSSVAFTSLIPGSLPHSTVSQTNFGGRRTISTEKLNDVLVLDVESEHIVNVWDHHQVVIHLPSFPVQGTNFNSRHFFRRCAEVITDNLRKFNNETLNSPHINTSANTVRAGLILLRGLYKLADGRLLLGLEDLHATAKEDANIFPEKLICEVIQSLTNKEMEAVKKCSFYIGDSFYKKESTPRTRRNIAESLFSEEDLPLLPLDHETFATIVEKCNITIDIDVTSTLFAALAKGSNGNLVETDVFVAFYRTWKQTIQDCELARSSIFRTSTGNSFKRPSSDSDGALKIGRSEQVLKVSGVVNSSKGTGRLILTTARLIFISAVSDDGKLIIDLSKVIHIKKSKIKSLFSSTSALSIQYQVFESSSQFKVGLKAECDLWQSIVVEMKTGLMLHKGFHDNLNSLLPPVAKKVLVADSLFTAARDEEFMSIPEAMLHVRSICNLRMMMDSGQLQALSPQTEESLQLRIDPSPNESKKPEVVCMMYSPASIEETPCVWVGLGSGKIRLIDTTQWKLDPIPIHDWTSKLSCMCMVKAGELWVGVEKGTIYCISTHDMKKTRILHDHTKQVVDIIKCNNGVVVSASLTGEVIVWQADGTDTQRKFLIPLKDGTTLLSIVEVQGDKIACCTSACVVVCSLLGTVMQTLQVSGAHNSITCIASNQTNEMWGGDNVGTLYMWNISEGATTTNKSLFGSKFTRGKTESDKNVVHQTITTKLPDVDGSKCSVTSMLCYDGKVWVGTSSGAIHILSAIDATCDRTLTAHSGPVLCLCKIENRYILSGAGGKDGKIVAWRE